MVFPVTQSSGRSNTTHVVLSKTTQAVVLAVQGSRHDSVFWDRRKRIVNHSYI